jgi:hypothetical protein
MPIRCIVGIKACLEFLNVYFRPYVFRNRASVWASTYTFLVVGAY